MTDPEKSAVLLSKAAEKMTKPLIASWMGGDRMQVASRLLNEAQIPTFEYPDAAARSFAYMWRYSSNLQALYETPVFTGRLPESGPPQVASIIAAAQKQNRIILTEHESKEVLAAYEIPTSATRIARDEEEAVAIAEELGYPVVVKLNSETVTHKSDRGGVHLNLVSADAVREAFKKVDEAFRSSGAFDGVTVQTMVSAYGYELILGSSTDPQFGPVLVFGLGGQLVEVLRDRAHALPPLTTTLARRVMENTNIIRALKGTRGRGAANLNALEELLVRFSELVIENPRIADIEINPLLAGPDVLVALDARVILHPACLSDSELPRPAIRPYPSHYMFDCTTRDGLSLTVRPIRPDDEPLVVKFHQQLSDRSVYLRYFLPLELRFRTSHERLITKCFIDYDREIALVAEHVDEQGAGIAGIVRLIRNHSGNKAEVALIIADEYQRRGLGTNLLRNIIEVAKRERIATLYGTMLWENSGMKDLFTKAGFHFARPQGGVASASLELT